MTERATIIDGQAIAAGRTRRLAERLRKSSGGPLGLGIVVATDNAATSKYIARKRQQAETVGYRVTVRELDPRSPLGAITAACDELNADDAIDAYIVQLPLPDGVAVDQALAAVDPAKDADGLAPANLAKLYAGEPTVIPATVKGILTLLAEYDVPVAGRAVTVVGQGRLTGKPLAALLEQRGAVVTRCDKSTADLPAATKAADILVTAVGHPDLITAGMVKPGATVIDVGTTWADGRIVGDVDFAEVSKKAAAITPVPGGVGPMTVVSLLENVADLAEIKSQNNG